MLCLLINQNRPLFCLSWWNVDVAHNCKFFDVSAFWNGSERAWTDRFWKKNAKRMAKPNLKLGKNNVTGPRVNLWPLQLTFWISFCRVWNIWTASLLSTLGLQLTGSMQRSKSLIFSDSMCLCYALAGTTSARFPLTHKPATAFTFWHKIAHKGCFRKKHHVNLCIQKASPSHIEKYGPKRP